MKKTLTLPSGLSAVLSMNLLTALLAFLVADGLIGLRRGGLDDSANRSALAKLLFFLVVVGLPILFRKKLTWKDDRFGVLILLLSFLLLRPVPKLLGFGQYARFLRSNSSDFIAIPLEALLIGGLLCLTVWGVQMGELYLFEWMRREKKSVKLPENWKVILLVALLTDLFVFYLGDGVFGFLSPTGFMLGMLGATLPCVIFVGKFSRSDLFLTAPFHIINFYLMRILLNEYSRNSIFAFHYSLIGDIFNQGYIRDAFLITFLLLMIQMLFVPTKKNGGESHVE